MCHERECEIKRHCVVKLDDIVTAVSDMSDLYSARGSSRTETGSAFRIELVTAFLQIQGVHLLW